MKLSDFFIGSRQLFGFIAPGAIWLSAWMLFNKPHPLVYLSGSDWGLRLVFFVGLSFVVGFMLQTLVFLALEIIDNIGWRRMVKSDATPDSLLGDINFVRPLLEEDLDVSIPLRRVPKYCRNITLEHCTYARYRIIEMESEINFMVALSFSLPFLSAAWMTSEWSKGAPKVLFAATALVSLVLGFKRVPAMRRNEKRMWCEKYLILRARSKWVRE